jgi:hypothetical protein
VVRSTRNVVEPDMSNGTLAKFFLLYAATGFIIGLITLRNEAEEIDSWEKPFILLSVTIMWPVWLVICFLYP